MSMASPTPPLLALSTPLTGASKLGRLGTAVSETNSEGTADLTPLVESESALAGSVGLLGPVDFECLFGVLVLLVLSSLLGIAHVWSFKVSAHFSAENFSC